jgi:hypothetical protein
LLFVLLASTPTRSRSGLSLGGALIELRFLADPLGLRLKLGDPAEAAQQDRGRGPAV